MVSPDVLVFVCANCTPSVQTLPRQWRHDDLTVRLKAFPCSGKIDTQYMMHALERGVRGICLWTCPHGECRLAEGNLRASVRVSTAKRLMAEAGLEPDRLILMTYAGNGASPEELQALVSETVASIAAKPPSPLQSK